MQYRYLIFLKGASIIASKAKSKAKAGKRKNPERRKIKVMKKRVISFILVSLTCLWLAGCGSNSSAAEMVSEQEQTEDTQVTASAGQSVEAEMTAPEQENTQTETAGQSDTEKRVARDDAQMQTEDPSMPTRIPMEGGTKINMYFGDTLITGVLNDSETAQALIDKLPVTQHVNRYSHDFCGVTEDLPYKEEEVHYGWLNGDIDYAIDAPYFTILFEDEDDSEQYGDQVNIGVITTPLSEIAILEGSYDVRIELAEE